MIKKCLGLLLLLAIVYSDTSAFATSPHIQDNTRRLYDRVMSEFKHRDYDAALAGFRLFLTLHGESALASNAQYWIGECQYRTGRYRDALKSFTDVVSNYPLSPKLPATTLKIGQTYVKLGDQEKARLMFDRVVDQYPDSAEAELARKAIEDITPSEDVPLSTPE